VSTSKGPRGLLRQFESETSGITEAPQPRWARSTALVLAALFLSIILITCVTKIDRVVTSASAKIVPTDRIKVFQALDPSIIKTIDVHEGDEVHAGELLATLDPTFTAADVTQLRRQVAIVRAQIERDEAQLSDRPLSQEQEPDPDVRKSVAEQWEYYKQQVAQYKAQLASFDAKISQAKATIRKFQADGSRYQQREEVAKQIEDMRAILAAHGTGSQYNLLTSQDQRLEILRTLEYDNNSLAEAQHTLGSVVADRDAFQEQWATQLSQDLATARTNFEATQASLEKALRRHELVHWTAAEPSVVLTIASVSVGSVLKEGDTLLTLMPLNTPVEAEIRINSRDVGFVRPGDRCVLKIDAFNYMEHGTAEGRVRWITENAFTVDDNGQPTDAYYKARCTVEATHFINVPPKLRLIPGMTLQADVNVGRRSVAMYLLAGVLRTFGEAMRVP